MVNKVILVGNCGKDPELRTTPAGKKVCSLTLATSESYKGADGQKQEKTEWHSLVAWDRLAEIIGQYVRKGHRLYIEGKLQTRSWDDPTSGEKKYKTEILIQEMKMLTSRQDGGGTGGGTGGGYGGGNSGGGYGGGGNYGGAGAGAPQNNQPAGAPYGQAPHDDDLPF